MGDHHRRSGETGVCKGCSAPILWIRTASGKAQPVDLQPVKLLILVNTCADSPSGRRVLKSKADRAAIGADTRSHVVDVWTPHHVTCPRAADFKGPGTGKGAKNGS